MHNDTLVKIIDWIDGLSSCYYRYIAQPSGENLTHLLGYVSSISSAGIIKELLTNTTKTHDSNITKQQKFNKKRSNKVSSRKA